MPRHQIKRYIQESACAECGRHVQGWGRAKCDNCGSTVCRRHRPLFTDHWACSHCRNAQHGMFASTDSEVRRAAVPCTADEVKETLRLAEATGDPALAEALVESLVRDPE